MNISTSFELFYLFLSATPHEYYAHLSVCAYSPKTQVIACEKELKRLLSQPPPKRPDPNFYLKRTAYKGVSGLNEALLEVTGNMEAEKGFAEYLYRQMNKPQPDNNIIPIDDTKKRIR
ncbi:MAG: hypothetical protein SFH39_12285 [Candidatus Magnetobacterium sp. LHC-1]